ncbi:MAG: hypothetical protein IJ268_13145 [Proteobacteria bacterium]|nr:hypothetical protein [Pseudomonadota bacterium]
MRRDIMGVLCASLLSLALTSCGGGGQCEQGATYAPQNAQALTAKQFDNDAKSREAFADIKNKFDKNIDFKIDVYEYESIYTAQEWMHRKQLKDIRETSKSFHGVLDNWEYQIDKNTAFVSAGHADDMHAMAPVPADALLSDQAYLEKAENWLKAIPENELKTSHMSVYPYKIRKYYIGVDDGESVSEGVSQVAVSFGTTLDGWPVLGPSKNAVHLAVDGTVIGYTKTARLPVKRAFRLSPDDIYTPDEALRLAADERGLKLNEAVISRSEFGYVDFGKHSVRELLYPCYVFVFPSPVGSKDLVSVIPAVKNPDWAARIDAGNAKELQRKSALESKEAGDEK